MLGFVSNAGIRLQTDWHQRLGMVSLYRRSGTNSEAEATQCTGRGVVVVCWLLNVPATCKCISGTDLLGQAYVLPEVADQRFYLTQSHYTDTRSTSPSADLMTQDAWQGSHWRVNFKSPVGLDPEKSPRRKRELNSGSSALEADA